MDGNSPWDGYPPWDGDCPRDLTILEYKLTGTDRRTNLGIGRYVPPKIVEPMQ